MTRPMTDSEVMDLIEATNFALADVTDKLEAAEKRISKLEQTVSVYGDLMDEWRNRVYALEHDTPQARRLQRELDETLADNAAAGYGPDEEW